MTGPWRPVCSARLTIFRPHTAPTDTSANSQVSQETLDAHTPRRTLISRGNGPRRLSVDTAVGHGGSGSRFLGKIPGSRNACIKLSSKTSERPISLTEDEDDRLANGATYGSKHARYCQQTHIGAHRCHCRTLVLPPPNARRPEPDTRDTQDDR